MSTRLIAYSIVNYDDVKLLEETIQSKLDNMIMEDISIKRKYKVQMFESLLPPPKIGDNNDHINPLILFAHLIALMTSEDAIAANVCY